MKKPSETIHRIREGYGVAKIVEEIDREKDDDQASEEQETSYAMYSSEVENTFKMAMAAASEEPDSYKEAMCCDNASKWSYAKRDQMQRLDAYQTWKLVVPLPDVNITDSRWVNRYKFDANGNIKSYHSRVVAKGFKQIYGLDYSETFAPVAKFTSNQTVLALVA